MSHWSYNIKIIFIKSKCNYFHLTYYLLFKIYYDYFKFTALWRDKGLMCGRPAAPQGDRERSLPT